jgi:hypothetical protein
VLRADDRVVAEAKSVLVAYDYAQRARSSCRRVEGEARRLMPSSNAQTLDNGLRVLTASMPQAQSDDVLRHSRGGSRYETPETNGIAHFAEHMFFKGTERRPTARDIAGEIDAIGGEFNAFTGKEYTGYYVKCAPSTATSRSTSSSTCSATRSSTPRRSSARRA